MSKPGNQNRHLVAFILTLVVLAFLLQTHSKAGKAAVASRQTNLTPGQWMRTAGPEGGNVYVLLRSGNNLFAGTCGEVFLSSDNGESWSSLGMGLPGNPCITSLAVHNTTLFAGTNGNGVFRYSEGTRSWTSANAGLPANITILSFAVRGPRILIGTSSGFPEQGGGKIFVSDDDGGNWIEVGKGIRRGLGELSPVAVWALVVNGSYIFASTDIGLFRSPDNGQHWGVVSPRFPLYTSFISLAVSGTNIFAAGGQGIYLSENDGRSWRLVNSGLPLGANFSALAADGSSVFAGTDYGIFRTTDNGYSWTPINAGLPQRTSVLSLVASDTKVFLGATGSGVFRLANNGQSWEQINRGLNGSTITALAFSGATLFAGTNGNGIFSSTNNGQSWTQVLPASYVSAFVISGVRIFAATDSGVFLSTDNGQSWATIAAMPSDLSAYALAINGDTLFVGTNDGLFSSGGMGWTRACEMERSAISALLVKGSYLYAGTGGDIIRYGISDRSCRKYQVIGGLSFLTSLTSLGTNLFAGVGSIPPFGPLVGGVSRSTNDGETWNYVDTGLPGNVVSALTLSGTSLLAGTDGGGVFFSNNNGERWMAVNAGLTNLRVRSLIASGSTLLAGTDGSGVFTLIGFNPAAINTNVQ